MKNKLLILLCLSNINFIQTETPATPEIRAATLAEFKKKLMCDGLIHNLLLKEKFEKTGGSFSSELIRGFAHLQSHLDNAKCDKYQDEIYNSAQTADAINAFNNKKNEELTIEELHEKEAAEIAFQISFLKSKYTWLRIRKEFDISEEEIDTLTKTVGQEIDNIFYGRN